MSRVADREAILAALDRHASAHRAMDWNALCELFEEQGTYFDPIHGWHRGRAAIREFLARTMRDAGPWEFLEDWRVVDEDRAVFRWTQRFSEPRPDGGRWEFSGLTTLRYGEEGLWAEQCDVYDSADAVAVLHDWAVARREALRAGGVTANRGATSPTSRRTTTSTGS